MAAAITAPKANTAQDVLVFIRTLILSWSSLEKCHQFIIIFRNGKFIDSMALAV